MIINIRKESRPPLRGTSREQENKPSGCSTSDESKLDILKHLKFTDSIIKPPKDQTGERIIPKQYSKANKIATLNVYKEENNMSMLDCLEQMQVVDQAYEQIANINKTQYRACAITYRANLQFMIRLARTGKLLLNIIDGGADTHVFGMAWLPLFKEGPNTPRADIVGFDDKAVRKYGLPIGPHATKVKDRNGRYIILKARHGVSNSTAEHTLLCTFQMREMGIIVDDVHNTRPRSNNGEKGTQCIEFEDGTKIDLICKSALMTFNIETSMYNEVFDGNIPVYDISLQHWNPQQQYDDKMAIPEESNDSDNGKIR